MDFFADTLGCFINHESESQCSTIVLNSHKRILNYLLLCSKKNKKKSYRFRTTWGEKMKLYLDLRELSLY